MSYYCKDCIVDACCVEACDDCFHISNHINNHNGEYIDNEKIKQRIYNRKISEIKQEFLKNIPKPIVSDFKVTEEGEKMLAEFPEQFKGALLEGFSHSVKFIESEIKKPFGRRGKPKDFQTKTEEDNKCINL